MPVYRSDTYCSFLIVDNKEVDCDHSKLNQGYFKRGYNIQGIVNAIKSMDETDNIVFKE